MSESVQFNIQVGDDLTWNVAPLLHEVKHALNKLVEDGKTSIIDLRSIPLAPGEEDTILKTLGQGEVHARLDALGPSEIIETQYSGVWLITHYNADDEVISRFIEVTYMPDILNAQKEDVVEAYGRLAATLENPELQNN